MASGLVGLAPRVQQDYVHDDNKHAHERLSPTRRPPMPTSSNLSFVLHDAARLFGTRLTYCNLLETCAQPAVDREKVHV
ncbi:hypothetical protein EN873_18205 [bacterium M00.F.Ca.ET.230.01.1.1]|nr:hypothetical protein EN873_18205 [bacterium M00.F.Ca.ET.230.01.1.1]